MPIWILLVVVAQLFHAVAAIIDKFIVTSKKVAEPLVYAFFVCVLSVLSLFIFFAELLPFDFVGEVSLPAITNIYLPDLFIILIAILAGYGFFFSLLFLYSALKESDASDVVPVVGAVSAVSTFVLSYLFLGEALSRNFIYGFIFLVVGTVIVSHFRFDLKTLFFSVMAGFFFSTHYTSMKVIFDLYAFDQAFFWSRIALIFVAGSLLFIPSLKKRINKGLKTSGPKAGFWVVGNNILGGTAGILVFKAIELGSVTIVQALGGLQFVFLIIISFLFGKRTSVDFGENNDLSAIIQKTVSVSLIVIGFYFLFL